MEIPFSHTLFLVLSGILGTLFGSFAYVVIKRLPLKESWIHTPSSCDTCNTRLGVRDLIPILSFLLSKKQCRYCKAPLESTYIKSEISFGILGAMLWWHISTLTISLPLSWLVFTLFLLLFLIVWYDIRYMEIPYSISRPILYGSIVYSLYTNTLGESIQGIIVIYGFFVLINTLFLGYASSQKKQAVLSHLLLAIVFIPWFFLPLSDKYFQSFKNLESERFAIGIGDYQLAIITGILLGNSSIVGLFTMYIIGAIMSFPLLIQKYILKHDRSSEVPFGPFIIFGVFFTLFYKENIQSILNLL